MINAQRSRVGLAFVIFGLIFMHYGAKTIIHKPSEDEEREILDQRQKNKRIEALEISFD